MIMMATLTKLLAINIIANNSFGFSSSFIAVSDALELVFSSSSLSAGPNEKKATSEPETNADMISKINKITNPTTKLVGSMVVANNVNIHV